MDVIKVQRYEEQEKVSDQLWRILEADGHRVLADDYRTRTEGMRRHSDHLRGMYHRKNTGSDLGAEEYGALLAEWLIARGWRPPKFLDVTKRP